MPEPSRPRVVVTRTEDQAEAFSEKLAAAGFAPVEFPAIALAPLPWEPLDAALAALDTFDWLVFTSGNAVSFFFQRVDELVNEGRLPAVIGYWLLVIGGNPITNTPVTKFPKVAASGSATARKLAERGVTVDFIPDEFVGEALVAGLGDLSGQKVLLPRAKIGRPEIIDLLQESGAAVTEVPLYDTVTATPAPQALDALRQGFEAITFTSPSSVRNFLKIADDIGLERALLNKRVIVCIGPITTQAAEERGLTVTLAPEEYTIDGMVAVLVDYFRKNGL